MTNIRGPFNICCCALETRVIGLQYYSGGSLRLGERCLIMRDANNPFDGNAFKVCKQDGKQVGILRKELANSLAPLYDSNKLDLKGIALADSDGENTVLIKIMIYSRLADYMNIYRRFLNYSDSEPCSASPTAQIPTITQSDEGKQIERELAESLPSTPQTAIFSVSQNKTEGKSKDSNRFPYLGRASPSISKNYISTLQSLRTRTPLEQVGLLLNEQIEQAAGNTGLPVINEDLSLVNAVHVDYEKFSATAWSEEDLINLEEFPQPLGLACSLLPYQRQGLGWMISCENPKLPESVEDKSVQFWVKRADDAFFNEATKFVSRAEPALFRGGILADDMGLGKTIQCLSLIQHDRESMDNFEQNPTLIVCPLAVLVNWTTQIETHIRVEYRPTFMVLHGSRTYALLKEIANHDIVLTTYGTLTSLYKNNPRSKLFTTKWRRIILDEAHCIRSKNTVSANACYALNAERRWCLTGTPIQNCVSDIFSLCKFLQFDPFSRDNWFKSLVSVPVRRKTTSGFGILKAILRCACLRRLKTMKLGGQQILSLPEVSRFICNVEMTGEEKARYDALEAESKHLYHEAVQNNTMQQIYPHIFEVLTRMRQVCDHYKLIRNRRIDIAMANLPADIASDPKKVQLARKLYSILIANEEFEDCAVCLEKVSESHAVITECAHIFCEECIDQVINIQHKCPICRHNLTKNNVLRSPPPVPEGDLLDEDDDYDKDVKEIINSTNHETSAKIVTMVKLLKKIRDESLDDKIIIVSQWTSMLDIIGKFLIEPFCRYDGAMNRAARDDVVDSFQNTFDGPKILLLSLKAGSLGLNLTAANRMIVMDPWYNPAVEQQAVDRINRIGQVKNVFVYRLIVKCSIEERILTMQESKLELHKEAFRENLNMTSKQMRLERIRKLVGE